MGGTVTTAVGSGEREHVGRQRRQGDSRSRGVRRMEVSGRGGDGTGVEETKDGGSKAR